MNVEKLILDFQEVRRQYTKDKKFIMAFEQIMRVRMTGVTSSTLMGASNVRAFYEFSHMPGVWYGVSQITSMLESMALDSMDVTAN